MPPKPRSDAEKQAAAQGFDVDAISKEIIAKVENTVLKDVEAVNTEVRERVNQISANLEAVSQQVQAITADTNVKFEAIQNILTELAQKMQAPAAGPKTEDRQELATILLPLVTGAMDKLVKPDIDALKKQTDVMKNTLIPTIQAAVKEQVDALKTEVLSRMDNLGARASSNNLEAGLEQEGGGESAVAVVQPRRAGIGEVVTNFISHLPPETMAKIVDKLLGGGQPAQNINAVSFFEGLTYGQKLKTGEVQIQDIGNALGITKPPAPAAK